MRSQQQQRPGKAAAELPRGRRALGGAARGRRTRAPGRLHIDPTSSTPAYAALDVHLQPAAMSATRSPDTCSTMASGLLPGRQRPGTSCRMVVDQVRAPRPTTAACSRCSTSAARLVSAPPRWKQRFPQAEVTGLDVGRPMVRYAHKARHRPRHRRALPPGPRQTRAAARGPVRRDLAYILFHEVPSRLFAPVVAEVPAAAPRWHVHRGRCANDAPPPAGNGCGCASTRVTTAGVFMAFVASDFRGCSRTRACRHRPRPTFPRSRATAVKDAGGDGRA